MDLWKIFVSEWPTLKGAVVSVITIALTVLAIGFGIGRYFGSEKISTLESRVTHRDEDIARLKLSIGAMKKQHLMLLISSLQAISSDVGSESDLVAQRAAEWEANAIAFLEVNYDQATAKLFKETGEPFPPGAESVESHRSGGSRMFSKWATGRTASLWKLIEGL